MSKRKKKPANYDPRRMYKENELAPYANFEIYDEDGATIGNVALPKETVEGKSPDEVREELFAFYRRAKAAEEYLDRDRVREIADSTKEKMVDALSLSVAHHMAVNIWVVYAERLGDDTFFDEEAFISFENRLKAITVDWFEDNPDVHVLIWQRVIARALEEIEGDYTPEALEAMSDDDFDDLINTYVFEKRNFVDSASDIMYKHAQDLAKVFVEAVDPAGLPLDHLEAFIGIERHEGTPQVTGGGSVTVEGEKREATEAAIFDRLLSVPSGKAWNALQEVVATRDFHLGSNSPWPTAQLNRKGARGTAQLRPAAMDEQPFMPAEEVEAWSKIMWRHRQQMTALDVDVMDALAAIYLQRTRNPNESAAADVDEILAMRGLKPKKGGSGTRGGYTPKQRAEVMAALYRIQSIWLDMAELEVIEEGPKGGRKLARKTIQSRPFVITDRMGQVRIDGYMDVERFIFKPGAVFAHYLHGPGRQTALLNAKILEFDPYRQAWEKNIGRYLSYLWRTRAHSGTYSAPLRVATLLERTGQEITPTRGSRIRERFEKALDTLAEHGVINGWQYERWNEEAAERRDWFQTWLEATVIIEPADEIEEHYHKIEQSHTEAPKHITAPKQGAVPKSADLGPKLKARRKQLRLTQMQAAEQLEITQAYFSQLERGKTKPGAALMKKIQQWLDGE